MPWSWPSVIQQVQGHCKNKLHSSCLCHILLWKMIKSKKLIQRLYVPEIMSSHWVLVTWRKKVHSFLSNREYLGYNIFSVGVSIVSLITVPQLTIVHCTPTRNIFLTTTCIYIMTHLLYFKMIANHWVGGCFASFFRPERRNIMLVIILYVIIITIYISKKCFLNLYFLSEHYMCYVFLKMIT